MAPSPQDDVSATAEVSFVGAVRSCLPTGFVVVDGQRRIVGMNETAAVWLGLDTSAVLQREFDALPGPQREAFLRAWASSDGAVDFSVDLPNPGGLRSSLHVRALRQHAPPSSMVLLLNEAAPAQDLEQHLARLDRLVTLGTLSAGLAHELRNALVTTKTFVSLLLEKDPAHELAEIVPREIHHIEGLLSQMLRQAGPEQPHLRVLDVHEVLDHSLRLVRHLLRGRQLALRQDYSSKPGLVKGDPDQLQQVFLNLLLNAAEATNPGGTLSIFTIAESGRIRVRIEDTGCGIPTDHLDRIFEPFFTTKPAGSGLGLATSRRIVRSHNGEIHATTQPGTGAVFTVDLPASPSPGYVIAAGKGRHQHSLSYFRIVA